MIRYCLVAMRNAKESDRVWLLAGRGHLSVAPRRAGCLEPAAMAGHERVCLRRRITAHETQVALQKYGP